MADRLRANLALNGLTNTVEVVEVAVGALEIDAALHLGESNLGRSSLRSIKSTRSIPVIVRPLVRYLPEQTRGYETFVIKIDVEGFEDEVLIPFLASVPGSASRMHERRKRFSPVLSKDWCAGVSRSQFGACNHSRGFGSCPNFDVPGVRGRSQIAPDMRIWPNNFRTGGCRASRPATAARATIRLSERIAFASPRVESG